MAHLFFNVLGEKYKGKGDKIPSMDVSAFEKMDHPIAMKIANFRSIGRSLASLEGCQQFIYPDTVFGGKPSPTGKKGLIKFNPVEFDLIERIFTKKKESIPINVDKRVRNTFVTGENQVWVGFDWKQAELCMLAVESGDSVLRHCLSGDNFHSEVYRMLKELPEEVEVLKKQRDLSKILSFGLIYSGFDIQSTKINLMKKDKTLTEDECDLVLKKYQEMFFGLFSWVDKTLQEWFDQDGWIEYFMNVKKHIPYPAYLKDDLEKMRKSKEGRQAINTFGQNGIGLLLKFIMSDMYKDEFVRENISQVIPVFDAIYFQAEKKHLEEILKRVNRFASPILEHNGFSIQMRPEFKVSEKSWGDVEKSEVLNLGVVKDPMVYQW